MDVNHLTTIDAKLAFTDVRNSLGSVDDETGTQVERRRSRPTSSTARSSRGSAPTTIAGSRCRRATRRSGSASRRASRRTIAREPFANFFFGGFGNNYVDHGDEKRYREYYGFPGAELNEIGGRNFVKSMVEWNLPPWRFRRVGTPGFYATWMRPALFVTGLATNLDDAVDAADVAVDAGAQLDFRFSMLSVLDLTLSVGGAMAFEDGHAPRREAMISLKVLR